MNSTRIHENSIDAYNSIKPKLNEKQTLVYGVIKKTTKGVTSVEVADSLGLTINQVTGRINELMHLQLIKIVGTRADRKKRNLYSIRLSSDPENEFKKTWKEIALDQEQEIERLNQKIENLLNNPKGSKIRIKNLKDSKVLEDHEMNYGRVLFDCHLKIYKIIGDKIAPVKNKDFIATIK